MYYLELAFYFGAVWSLHPFLAISSEERVCFCFSGGLLLLFICVQYRKIFIYGQRWIQRRVSGAVAPQTTL